MVQSVELLLDDEADAAVRAQWALLARAGLPSQARHSGPTNAPHVTLAARRGVPATVEPALRAVVGRTLPLPVRLGALGVFGRRRFVLVRLVVPERALLALHRAVFYALGPDPGAPADDGTLSPGRWTPHVTLARGLPAEQVGSALTALTALKGGGGVVGAGATAVGCRRWDGDARRAWSLTGPDGA